MYTFFASLLLHRFIEDPAVAFPEGLLVSGRIVAAEKSGPKGGGQEQQPRLEMTLRCGVDVAFVSGLLGPAARSS